MKKYNKLRFIIEEDESVGFYIFIFNNDSQESEDAAKHFVKNRFLITDKWEKMVGNSILNPSIQCTLQVAHGQENEST